MPVIKLNDQQYSLNAGRTRLGAGADADVRVGDDDALGVLAIVEVAGDQKAVIRRAKEGAAVRVNGVALVDPTPLMHGDKVDIAGHELLYADDSKDGATKFVSANDVAAIMAKRSGPARATTGTGGRVVSLVDGKEYAVPDGGITIGRDAGNGIVVAQTDVSRRHAEIAPAENGYVVRDLSANGLYVNGDRVQQSRVLARADVIRVGTEEFRFYADVAPVVPKPAASVPRSPSTPAPGASPVAAAAAPTPVTPPLAVPAADTRPIAAVLEVTNEGITKGTKYEIRGVIAHIGRGAQNDVVLDDDSVSDTHAMLHRREDGWYLIDLGSTNGSYVGGMRLTGEQRLQGNPDLRFGGVKTVLRPQGAGADTGKGTRAIAAVSQAKLSNTMAIPAAPRPAATPATPAAPVKSGVPGWVWIIAALVVLGAGAAFFLMKR